MSFLINGHHFSTRRAVANHCAAILRRGEICTDDQKFLVALLERHPKHAEKVGSGIAAIEIGSNGFGEQSFFVRRIDGTRTEFSYVSCIRETPRERQAVAILRSAIASQLEEFRVRAFRGVDDVRCAATDKPLGLDGACVEHHPITPLSTLIERFLRGHGAQLTDVRADDRPLLRAWKVFHADHAVLRLVTARAA